MVALIWVRGLIAHRPARILATVLGVAVGVALIAAIGTFLSATTSRMTQRAIARVPVDWQVQAQTGARPSRRALRRSAAFPGCSHALPVSFTDRPRPDERPLAGSTQTTGAAQVLGLPAGYARTFPDELRLLTGSLNGPLLAQQTASNLHAAPGSSVTSRSPAAHGSRDDRRRGRSARRRLPVSEPSARRPALSSRRPAGQRAAAARDRPSRASYAPVRASRPELIRHQVHVAARAPAAGQPERRLRGHHLPGAQPREPARRIGHRRQQPRRRAGQRPRGRALRPDPVPVPRRPRRRPGRTADRSDRIGGADRRRRDAALLRTRGASTRTLVGSALGRDAARRRPRGARSAWVRRC